MFDARSDREHLWVFAALALGALAGCKSKSTTSVVGPEPSAAPSVSAPAPTAPSEHAVAEPPPPVAPPAEPTRAVASAPPLDEVVSISASGRHTCALRKNGEVWCWGEEKSSVGDEDAYTARPIGPAYEFATREHAPPPTMMALPEPATAVWAGSPDCVRLKSGIVRCGETDYPWAAKATTIVEGWALVEGRVYELATLATSLPPVSMTSPVTSASASASASASTSATASVAAAPSGVASVRVAASSAPSSSVAAPSASTSAAPAPAPSERVAPPPETMGLTEWTDVARLAAYGASVCIVRKGGDLHCYTRGATGEDTAPAIHDALDVAVGASHVCARLKPNKAAAGHPFYRVACWGENGMGQSGPAHMCPWKDAKMPFLSGGPSCDPVALQEVPAGRGALGITAGAMHTCIRAEGKSWCWGDTRFGQCGQLDFTERDGQKESLTIAHMIQGTGGAASFDAIYKLPYLRGNDRTGGAERPGTALSIVAGADHTCVLTEQHTVLCQGHGVQGQLGNCVRQDSTSETVGTACPDPVPEPLHPLVETGNLHIDNPMNPESNR
jgi:hypothetical protein